MNSFFNIIRLQFLMPRLIEYAKLMRFDRPIGIVLLLWPVLWGLWLAAKGMPPVNILIIFLVGTIVTRALGCVINDVADRRFDPHVARTNQRPLAAGTVSLREALGIATVLAGIAFYLASLLDPFAVLLALFAGVLIALYPFVKRFFPWPQFVLGVVFGGMPILIGFAAVDNHLSSAAWVLAFASCCWTIAYDTMYALSDKEDDLKIGVKSTAIWFGRYVLQWIIVFQVIMLLALCYVGFLAKLSPWYYVSLLLSAAFFVYHNRLIKNKNRQQCFFAFLHNKWVGLVIFVGIMLGFIS